MALESGCASYQATLVANQTNSKTYWKQKALNLFLKQIQLGINLPLQSH